MKTLLPLLAAITLCSGCVYTSYTDPSGAKFSRVSLFGNQSVGEVSVKAGDKAMVLKGYTSEQTAAIDTAVTAAVRAATAR